MNYDIVNESKMTVMFYDANKIEAQRINTVCFFDNKNALVDFKKFENKNRIVKTFEYPLIKTANYHVEVIAESKKDNSYLAYIPSYIYINKGDGMPGFFVRKKIFLYFFLEFSLNFSQIVNFY